MRIVRVNSVIHLYTALTKLPFVRGIFNFVDSLVLGMKTLTWSASFYEEEEEKEMTEVEEKKQERLNKFFQNEVVRGESDWFTTRQISRKLGRISEGRMEKRGWIQHILFLGIFHFLHSQSQRLERFRFPPLRGEPGSRGYDRSADKSVPSLRVIHQSQSD